MKRLVLMVALWVMTACGGDDGPGDGGRFDAGPVDAGGSDAGPMDAGSPDAGPPDGGTDAGPLDGGSEDAGGADAGADAGADGGSDAGVDAGPADAGHDGGDLDAGSFGIGGVDYGVIARGGALEVRGAGLMGATAASLGGVSHAVTAVTDTSLVIEAVQSSTPLGRQPLTVTTPTGTTAPFEVTVIHLQINEVEADSPGTDDAEFVEVSTGVDAVLSLRGYVLAHYNGSASASTPRIFSLDLAEGDAVTDGAGLLLVADDGVPASRDIALPADLQQGEELLVVLQRREAAPATPSEIDAGLIDAVVWESGDDADEFALDRFTTGSARIAQIGRSAQARNTTTIQRCGREEPLRDVSTFVRETPSPGLPNHCGDAVAALPACVIDFGTVCPNTHEGRCGAYFQANRSDRCAAPVAAECSVAGVGYGADVSDGGARVDIFFEDGVRQLDTFFIAQDSAEATMRFFDLDGAEIDVTDSTSDGPPGPVEAGGDCLTLTSPHDLLEVRRITVDGGGATIRRIQITGEQGFWLDNFVINPAP